MLAGPLEVLQHPRLGVAEALDLQQRQRPADLVPRAGPAHHQPLAAQRLDPRQLGTQVAQVAAGLVLVHPGVGRPVPLDVVADEGQPVLEGAVLRRGVEDDEGHLLPQVALVLPPDDADGALERLAADPQLAVERDVRQPGE